MKKLKSKNAEISGNNRMDIHVRECEQETGSTDERKKQNI